MNKAVTHPFQKLLLVGIASAALGIGASTAASASTGTTEPVDDMTEHTEAEHTMESAPAALAVDGSAEASSPEAEAFCTAEIAVEAAANSEDPAAIGPALEAATAAAGPADAAPLLEAVVANIENTESPEFAEAYGALIDYMKANCGFAELGVVASEYAFGGVPAELPAGPIIVSFENIGTEYHEVLVLRLNDDVTMSVDELAELSIEELMTVGTIIGGAFGPPGATAQAVVDLTPGRHLALCFLPQGATPEMMEQMEAAEGTAPEGSAPADSAPAGTEPVGTAPAGSAPAGSAPSGPPSHYQLGMIQEFTVV